jgi:phospholipase C
LSDREPRQSDVSPEEATGDDHMGRREFLTRTAGLAGLAGLATVLPAENLISQAAKVQTQAGFPSPRNIPIDTFVVVMMENRSFDHYLGWFPGADGKNKGLHYPDEQGKQHATHPLAPDFQGCGFADPDHSFEGGRTEYNHGKLDGFYIANDEYAIGYYDEPDLPFLPHVAKEFTLYDRYFASLLGPTYPNRFYMWSAQSGGQTTNEIPSGTLGNNWETIFDRAQAQGLSVGYYGSDLPFAALFGKRALPWIRHVSDYYADAAAGRLPNIAFVDPPFNGEEQGISGDEHPHGDIRYGQTFMSEVTHAFLSSPQFRRGAMFINYDEWGGFFDHVSPRFVPDARQSNKLSKTFGVTGFRVPGVAISPYVRRGHVSHATVTHESILKLISYRFGLGFLNKRHRYASQIGRTFDWDNPNFEVPDLPRPVFPPGPVCVGSQPKSPGEKREGPAIDSTEFRDYLDRLGVKWQPATPDRIFPDPGRFRRVPALTRDRGGR